MRGSSKRCARRLQGGRRGRRWGSNSTSDKNRCPETSVAPTENPLVTFMSIASCEGKDEMVKRLKRKLEEIAKNENEVKSYVSKLKRDLLYNSTHMKPLKLHVESLEEHSKKPAAENESPRVTKQEIIALQMNSFPPKISKKATKINAECIE